MSADKPTPPRVVFRDLDKIAAGVYADRHGAMHIDMPELLAGRTGYADTSDNRAAVVEALRTLLPGTPIEDVE
jgi:hypothetical protein